MDASRATFEIVWSEPCGVFVLRRCWEPPRLRWWEVLGPIYSAVAPPPIGFYPTREAAEAALSRMLTTPFTRYDADGHLIDAREERG